MREYWTLNIPKPPRHFNLLVGANILMVAGLVIGIGGIGGTEVGRESLLFGVITACLGGGMCFLALYLVKIYESRLILDYGKENDRRLTDRNLAKEIGNRLKVIRQKKQRGSQMKVAKLIGISRFTLMKYENGDMMPSAQTLIDLADFYQVSVDYILGREQKSESKLQSDEKAYPSGDTQQEFTIFK